MMHQVCLSWAHYTGNGEKGNKRLIFVGAVLAMSKLPGEFVSSAWFIRAKKLLYKFSESRRAFGDSK
jgi:hypothetical protein